MEAHPLGEDLSQLMTFDVVQASDPRELDNRSRVSERLPKPSRVYKYHLLDHALWHRRFDRPIFSLATRRAGTMVVSFGSSAFATDVSIDGEESDHVCFTTLLHGDMTVLQEGQSATASAASGQGLVFRLGARTQLLTSDDSLRSNVFLKVTEIEATLERLLDQRLQRPLAFAPCIAWRGGLAASLKTQLDVVTQEFRRPDGIAGNAVALASATDLLVTLALQALPHSYTDRLHRPGGAAIPAYLRRAEAFMHAHCAEPIRMTQVAEAAGCSLRTLAAVFRSFRDTTPLAALHGIRLDEVHRSLRADATGAPVAEVARRHGFTNPARFNGAFRRRFGQAPSEVWRRARAS